MAQQRKSQSILITPFLSQLKNQTNYSNLLWGDPHILLFSALGHSARLENEKRTLPTVDVTNWFFGVHDFSLGDVHSVIRTITFDSHRSQVRNAELAAVLTRTTRDVEAGEELQMDYITFRSYPENDSFHINLLNNICNSGYGMVAPDGGDLLIGYSDGDALPIADN